VEPSERHWANPVRERREDWLAEQLSNVERLVEAGRVDAAPTHGMDNVQVRVAAPQIVARPSGWRRPSCRSARRATP